MAVLRHIRCNTSAKLQYFSYIRNRTFMVFFRCTLFLKSSIVCRDVDSIKTIVTGSQASGFLLFLSPLSAVECMEKSVLPVETGDGI